MNTVHDPTNGANIPRNALSNALLKLPLVIRKIIFEGETQEDAERDPGMGSGEDERFGAETKGGRRKTTRNRVHSRVEMAGCARARVYMHACVHKDGA